MTRLERLDICRFRGIPELSLPFDGGSIILGGANGTGKSACVDAVEFLYTGEVASLAGMQGITLKQHGPHILHPAAQTRVAGVYREPRGEVNRPLTGRVNIPADLVAHFQQGARVTFVLRRAQVQQFIHARAAERYRHMAELIGLEHLDRVETALKRARDQAEREVEGLRRRLDEVERRLEELPEDWHDPIDLVRHANEALEAIGSEYHLGGMEDVPALRAQALRALGDRRPDPRLQASAALAGALERSIGGRTLLAALDEYLALAGGGPGGAPREGVELLQLLRRGRTYLAEHNSAECPLCGRPINSHALLAQLIDRVAALEEVSLHEQRLRQAQDDLIAAWQDTSGRIRSLDPLLAAAGRRAPNGAVIDAAMMMMESVRAGALVESRDMGVRLRDSLVRWAEWSRAAAEELAAELAPSDESPGPEAQVLAILEQLNVGQARAERARQEHDRLDAERQQAAAEVGPAVRTLAVADLTYTTFNRVKNDEVQRVFDGLQVDLARMYDFLHPGEGHGALAIEMDPRKRGSSELRMGFYERAEEDPRAFASEGHLDSLGLCIFLAFVKRFGGDWPLLVLDDVVTSVDAGHKQRIAQLLFREFGDRQLLVTTQDSRWFQDLRRAHGETPGAAPVHALVIESWSLENGPRLREM